MIERKVCSFNSSNSQRNLLQTNNTNKSFNNINHKNKNISKNQKAKFKYKTIENIFIENSSKRAKNENPNAIRINNNFIKPYIYSNYHSINSFRGKKKLDKSDSRSLFSRKNISKSKIWLPEDSNNSKNFMSSNNNNKSNLNSKIKNESDNLLSNKNKILINYSTNIINTNVSINKLTIKQQQKMKDIRKTIDEKIFEITRNKKKNNIHRTVSAVYDKRKKIPIYNDKTKTKREPSFNHNRMNNSKMNSNFSKIDIRTKKNSNNNKYNSKLFTQNLIQYKNKKNKNLKSQKSRTKIKRKSNSMSHIKKNNLKEEMDKNNNKVFIVHAYSSRKKDERIRLFKNSDNKINELKKKSERLHKNNRIISGKNSNLDITNNKTLINLNRDVPLSDRLSLYHEKLSQSKHKKLDSNKYYNYSNKMNPSLRKYMFNKCISNSNFS